LADWQLTASSHLLLHSSRFFLLLLGGGMAADCRSSGIGTLAQRLLSSFYGEKSGAQNGAASLATLLLPLLPSSVSAVSPMPTAAWAMEWMWWYSSTNR
jgi:hypothetical protein